MGRNTKGSRREWEFCRLIDETDEWAVMRSPASGTADREMPDMFVGNGDRVLAIELKASAKKPAYVSERELRDLRYLAKKFNAEPYAGVIHDVVYDHPAHGVDTDPGFRFLSVSEEDEMGDTLRFTEGGNLSLRRKGTLEAGETFTDLFGFSAFDEEIVTDGGRLVDPQLCPFCSANEAREVVALPGEQGVVLACPWCADQMETVHE